MKNNKPRSGMLGRVRNRNGLVTQVDEFPSPTEGDLHFVRVEYTDQDDPQEEYVLHIGPDDWEQLKGLVDETFAHTRSYLEKNPDEDDK